MLLLQHPIRISCSFLQLQLALTWAERYVGAHAMGTDSVKTFYPGCIMTSKFGWAPQYCLV
jgi:hypothetical protein